MKTARLAALGLVLLALFFAVGCTADDPLEEIYITDGHFVSVESDNFILGGAPLLIPACGEMYITTPIATPLTLADTFYKALGTTVAGELRGFTDGEGRLTYNDITPDRICLVTGAMSLKSDTAMNVISAKLYINDLPSDSSLIKIKLLQAGDIDTMSLIALVILQPGDYAEVWLASDKAGVEVTLEGLDFTATTVD